MRLRNFASTIIFIALFSCLQAELFSLIAGSAVLGGILGSFSYSHHFEEKGFLESIQATASQGTGVFIAFKDRIKCKFYECCELPYINPNFGVLENELKNIVFGQHLVRHTVVNSIQSHWNSKPKKPLVLSFHGNTGCGKNYVTSIIAKNIYKNGMNSKFVHHIIATAEYPDVSRMAQYQEELQKRLLRGASVCGRALFIFDEVDKMPEQLLATIKPFMDNHENVMGVDFRRSIFIFISNRGSEEILKTSLLQHENGKAREDLELTDFEGKVAHNTYNVPGGMKMSEIISNHLIDHYIPFLPLERNHVEQCIRTYFSSDEFADGLENNKEMVHKVADALQYYPKQTRIYSSSGCKRVKQKADLIASKFKLHTHADDIDEL